MEFWGVGWGVRLKWGVDGVGRMKVIGRLVVFLFVYSFVCRILVTLSFCEVILLMIVVFLVFIVGILLNCC